LSPVLRMILAVILCAMAAWFKRYRFDRGEPAHWFFALMIVFALSLGLSAISWWIRNDAISKSFWIAYWLALSGSSFLVFCFSRSFGPKADFKLLFFSIPLMFNLALVIVNETYLLERSGSTWVPQTGNAVYFVYWGINAVYAVLSVYYCVVAYVALRSHGQKEETANFRYVLYGLVVIIISQLAAGPLRAALNPGNPVSEIGTLAGMLLLLVGVMEPKLSLKGFKRQGVA
jgi:hypothetical protein